MGHFRLSTCIAIFDLLTGLAFGGMISIGKRQVCWLTTASLLVYHVLQP